jgi:hypothetical protein
MDKSLKYIFVLLFFLIVSPASAQLFKGYAAFGLNLSKVEGDRVNNGMFAFNKPGINIGPGVMLDLKKNFSLSMEVLFSQKGALRRKGDPDSAQPAYLTRLDYAEIPILVHYTDKGKYTFGTGISYSRLMNLKWVVNGNTLSNSVNDGYFAENNIDWIADFMLKVWKGLKFNFRYSYSLKTIWSGEEDELLETIGGEVQDMNQRNSMITFRLVWVFNERAAEQNKTELNNSR